MGVCVSYLRSKGWTFLLGHGREHLSIAKLLQSHHHHCHRTYPTPSREDKYQLSLIDPCDCIVLQTAWQSPVINCSGRASELRGIIILVGTWQTTRVATHPGFPGMSRICAMLSRVPARPALGCQISRISRYSQNDENNNNNTHTHV